MNHPTERLAIMSESAFYTEYDTMMQHCNNAIACFKANPKLNTGRNAEVLQELHARLRLCEKAQAVLGAALHLYHSPDDMMDAYSIASKDFIIKRFDKLVFALGFVQCRR